MQRLLYIAVLLSALLLPTTGWATTYYIDNTVGSSGNGLAWATAWKNATDITGLVPGDTVYISGGPAGQTYTWPLNWAPTSGTAGNPITFAVGQDASHNGIVTFTNASASGNAWFAPTGVSYVTINGEVSGVRKMTIDPNYTYTCFSINVSEKHIRILYITALDTVYHCKGRYQELAYSYMTGVTPNGQDALLYQFADDGADYPPGAGEAYGLNSIHHNYFEVSRKRNAGLGWDVLIWTECTDFYNNTLISMYDAGYTGGQHADGLQFAGNYNRIYNNYIENFQNANIFVETFQPTLNIQIFNNTLVALDAAADWGAYSCIIIGNGPPTTNSLTNFVVANNLCIGNTTAPNLHTGGIHVNTYDKNTWSNSFIYNNLFYGNLETVADGGTGTHPTTSNNVLDDAHMAFVNVTGSALYPTIDTHLTAGATAAIGTGLNLTSLGITALNSDAGAVARPVTLPWTLGPYGFGDPAPAAPTGQHVATFTGPTWAVLIWTANTEADFAGSSVFRSTTSGSYSTTPLATLTPALAATRRSPITQWFDSTLYTAGTYYYTIKHYDTGNNLSSASAEVSVTVTGKQ